MFALRVCIAMALVCIENVEYQRQLQNLSQNYSGILSEELNSTQVYVRPSSMVPNEMRGILLSSYFYGYLITPLLGGLISQRCGPKLVVLLAMGIAVITNGLTPLSLRYRIEVVVTLRVIMGISTGVILPSLQVLWADWAPKNEKARLLAVSSSGVNLGNVVATGIAGFVCKIPVDDGWPFIFYIFGLGTIIWMIFWWWIVYNSPDKHPRISEREKVYIESGKVKSVSKKIPRVPWSKVLTSLPFLAILTCHVCHAWTITLISLFLPIYMNDVLKFDVTDNGVLSSLPFICRFIMGLVFAVLADVIVTRKLLPVSHNRKLFQIIGMVFPSVIIIGLSFLDSEQRNLVVGLMTLAVGFQSATTAAFRVNHLDIAPRFAGTIAGLTVNIACVVAICVPIITTALTPDVITILSTVSFINSSL
ncbi:sialin isoform X2 [Patella vulgata]|uniref:sialin isoform X2 n=1 Tax=Patella vulgata TaxID=6465 RepID=UPI0024A84BC2|nr:sialin isoform X2 [Patella vulgata]